MSHAILMVIIALIGIFFSFVIMESSNMLVKLIGFILLVVNILGCARWLKIYVDEHPECKDKIIEIRIGDYQDTNKQTDGETYYSDEEMFQSNF